jgi:apurinic endonuclease APN1
MKKTKKNININININKNINAQKPDLQVGCHASIANGILEGIKYVESIGGNALQIFMGSKLQSSLKYKHKFKDQNEIDEIRQYISKNNICLVIHSIYTINLCKFAYTSGRIKYAQDNILYDLKYGNMIGAKCVILHLGSKNKELTYEEALNNIVGNIKYIISKMPKGIMLSLETAAGSGSQLGWNLEELSNIWQKCMSSFRTGSHKSSLGICIDTAHIFVSGYDISTVEGIKDYLNKFDDLIGLKYITNFHINDSRYTLNSKHDEHRGIGHGLIYNTDKGKKALKYIKQLCIKRKIPMILETHSAGSAGSAAVNNKDKEKEREKDEGSYQYEIDLIKKL